MIYIIIIKCVKILFVNIGLCFLSFFFFVRKCFYYLRWLCFCFVWFIIMVVFRCCILVFVIFNVGVFGKFGINVGWVLLF